jgi:hypothetical protein
VLIASPPDSDSSKACHLIASEVDDCAAISRVVILLGSWPAIAVIEGDMTAAATLLTA